MVDINQIMKTKIKRVVKEKSTKEKNKIAEKILLEHTVTRDQANYLIKTVLGMTISEFSKAANIQFRYLSDALLMLRPFNQDLQNQIIFYCREKLR